MYLLWLMPILQKIVRNEVQNNFSFCDSKSKVKKLMKYWLIDAIKFRSIVIGMSQQKIFNFCFLVQKGSNFVFAR